MNNKREGNILFITMLILMGIGLLLYSMVTVAMTHSSSSDYCKFKMQTYNVANGALTVLSQDMVDYNSNIKLDEFIVMPNHIHGIILKWNT